MREGEKGQGVKPSEEVRRHQTCSADKKKNDQEDEEKKKGESRGIVNRELSMTASGKTYINFPCR